MNKIISDYDLFNDSAYCLLPTGPALPTQAQLTRLRDLACSNKAAAITRGEELGVPADVLRKLFMVKSLIQLVHCAPERHEFVSGDYVRPHGARLPKSYWLNAEGRGNLLSQVYGENYLSTASSLLRAR